MLTLASSPGDGLYKELAGKYLQSLCTQEQDKRSQGSDSLLDQSWLPSVASSGWVSLSHAMGHRGAEGMGEAFGSMPEPTPRSV